MTELLPCPFCGGEAHETSPEERGDEYWRITCVSCGARIGGTHRGINRKSWNTRAERTCHSKDVLVQVYAETIAELEQLCRDLYREGCYYWLLTNNDPPYSRGAWCDDFCSRMDALGLLEVDE